MFCLVYWYYEEFKNRYVFVVRVEESRRSVPSHP